MSDILHTIDHMRARGVSADAILEAVYALEAARADKLEQRREADRGRQRRHRLGKSLEKPESVSRDTFTVTTGETPDPQGFPSTPSLPKPPVSPSLSMSGASTRDERLAALRDLQQNHWNEILEVCKSRVNGSMAAGPGAMDISPIIRLMAPMDDEPCDLQADILPAIDFKVAQAHQTGKPIKAWSWIEERARHNRDARLKPPPAPETSNGRHERPSSGGGAAPYRGRGPTEDPLDRALARVGRRQADPDVIDHPVIVGTVRAS